VHRITGPGPELEPNVITASRPAGFIQEGDRLVLSAPFGSDYQWKKDGVDVTADPGDPGRITGITSKDLVFDPVQQSDAGVYTCVYTNAADEEVETAPYTLEVLPPGSLPVVNSLFLLMAVTVLMVGGLSAAWVRR
jgi:hypothetical protein